MEQNMEKETGNCERVVKPRWQVRGTESLGFIILNEQGNEIAKCGSAETAQDICDLHNRAVNCLEQKLAKAEETQWRRFDVEAMKASLPIMVVSQDKPGDFILEDDPQVVDVLNALCKEEPKVAEILRWYPIPRMEAQGIGARKEQA